MITKEMLKKVNKKWARKGPHSVDIELPGEGCSYITFGVCGLTVNRVYSRGVRKTKSVNYWRLKNLAQINEELNSQEWQKEAV